MGPSQTPGYLSRRLLVMWMFENGPQGVSFMLWTQGNSLFTVELQMLSV